MLTETPMVARTQRLSTRWVVYGALAFAVPLIAGLLWMGPGLWLRALSAGGMAQVLVIVAAAALLAVVGSAAGAVYYRWTAVVSTNWEREGRWRRQRGAMFAMASIALSLLSYAGIASLVIGLR